MSASPVLQIMRLEFPWATQDPFLFCVHHRDAYPKGNDNLGPAASLEGRELGMDFEPRDGWRMYHGEKVPGFPQHPHRGFETVTVVRQGFVDHADSLGAAGRYGPGDVQWMTAGQGIVHAEMFPLLQKDKPNTLELFQIWLNLPSQNKMCQPHFAMLWQDQIPTKTYKDKEGRSIEVTLNAGPLGGLTPPGAPPRSWASMPGSDVAIWQIKLAPGAVWDLPPAAPGIHRRLYFFKGKTLSAGGTKIPFYHGADLVPVAGVLLENGPEESEVLILQGRPIGEPVVKYGPFVMNTNQEIRQAFSDYQQTEFGGWPWKESDPHHGRETGRFARHADGHTEKRA